MLLYSNPKGLFYFIKLLLDEDITGREGVASSGRSGGYLLYHDVRSLVENWTPPKVLGGWRH